MASSDEAQDVTRAGNAAGDITEITDEDYRCVWRPCPVLEEPGEHVAAAGQVPRADRPRERAAPGKGRAAEKLNGKRS